MRAKKNQNFVPATVTSLEYIAKFSTVLASTLDLEKLYNDSLSLIKEFFRLDYSTLFLLDENLGNLVVRATIGFPQEMINSFVLQQNQGLSSRVLQTGTLETVEDFRREEDCFAVTDIIEELNIRSAIAAPMFIANRIFGVVIGHTLKKRTFTSREKQVFQILANHAAFAINNAMTISSLCISEQQRVKKIRELQREKDKTQELTDEFESIFTNITTGILLLKKDRRIARCNEKLADMLGYDSARQLENISARKLHISEGKYRQFGQKNYENLISGKIIQTDYTLRKKDGSTILCRLSGRAVDQANPPDLGKGFVWLVEDITRRREMEKEVLQARKLESIGILAGGIGHDYNNILSAILGNLGLAQRILEPGHAIHDLLRSALEAADKARDLTEKLLLFTRREGSSPGSVRLSHLFREVNFTKLLSDKINLHTDFQQGLFMIKIMPDHLKVILQNLLLNADSCMPGGGKVTVTGHNIEVLSNVIPGLSSGKYVELSVADTGSGIEQDILDNVFDPYFTTKNRDSTKGIGLGLAIVHAIVKKNHGNITVRAGKEKGTVFTVMLPAVLDEQQLPGNG